MTYRDILVQVASGEEGAARARLASSVAGRFGAHLTGVFLKSAFLRQYMAPEAVAGLPASEIRRLVDEHEAAVDRAAEAGRLVFEAAAADADVKSSWMTISGDTPFDLLACVRRMDLTIMPVSCTAALGQEKITAASVALGGGGPVLVVPDGVSASFGKRALVAWNGSREAARALRDAWPLLQAADEVHVLVVAREGDGGPESLLQRHLERHGCTSDIVVDRSDDAQAAAVIRRHAEALKADLLVMGVYGRPRLQELVLGGVSHDLLAAPPAPLLLSH